MTTLRVKDPQAMMERVGTFVDVVKQGIARRARLRAVVDGASKADVEATLKEALEVVDVQHAALVAAEEELREQVDELARTLGVVQVERERYQQLFDAAPDAYFVTDANGVIREANEHASTMLGVSSRFICGKPLALYVSTSTTSRLRESLTATTTESREVRVELVGRRGAPLPVRMRARRLDHSGRILWIAREEEGALPTEIGDLARALRDKDDLLERERRERERLERESRAKDRFLAILSHDLRAPLNAVLGWADLLRREVLDQGRRERAVATIDRNARALLGLIEELLDISRITADRMQLDVRPLDLSGLVRRIVEATHPLAREKGIVLGYSTEDGVVVIADGKRIEQCITNLLSNALEFTPAGGNVDVVVTRQGDHARITVRDTGKGISAAMLSHVFECYRQGDEPQSKIGLGLGLFIVRQIAHLHGGTAHAASEGEGRGSTFTIEIPVADRGPAAEESKASVAIAGDLTGMRVLVVDDDEDTRELVATLLGTAGAHVASAPDKTQACALIETWSPDAIISDMSMQTHEDGLGVVRAARDRYGDDVIVIALTGFAAERDAARSLAAGFDAHLTKPLASGELIAALERLRDAHGGGKRDST